MYDSLLNLLDVVDILEVGDNECVALGFLDPVHCLTLWVDVQSPSESFGHEYTVFSGELIRWQSIHLPYSSLGSSSHEFRKIKASGEWDLVQFHS